MKSKHALICGFTLLLSTFAFPIESAVYIEERDPYELVGHEPPAPFEEVVTPAPSSNYAWIPGRWRWDGGGWTNVKGHWVPKPHPDAAWVVGGWRKKPHGWVWVRGHWE